MGGRGRRVQQPYQRSRGRFQPRRQVHGLRVVQRNLMSPSHEGVIAMLFTVIHIYMEIQIHIHMCR